MNIIEKLSQLDIIIHGKSDTYILDEAYYISFVKKENGAYVHYYEVFYNSEEIIIYEFNPYGLRSEDSISFQKKLTHVPFYKIIELIVSKISDHTGFDFKKSKDFYK